MPDYKELYLQLFRATEKAVELLIEAQRCAEEAYLSAEEPEPGGSCAAGNMRTQNETGPDA